ncbi:MAG: hypothetical protein QOJ75_1977 [Chloroflexota bacterium]|jgi:hypothetical protein|nr:hypothetical protein [Chloroflexota bacterium]
MNPRRTFEDQLQDLMEDGPAEAPSPLLDTILGAFPAIPQRRGATRFPWRTPRMHGYARVLAGMAVVVVVGSAALIVASGQLPAGVGGVGGPPSNSPAIAASPAPASSGPASATPSVGTSLEPTVAPTIGPCAVAQLAARITLWEGAAGHRIAHVELTNQGPSPCLEQATAKPQLVDGRDTILIDGVAPSGSDTLTLAGGAILTTLVQDGNYCGPAPVAPVTVAFVLADGGRIVATPLSPTDATVPPCLGAAGSAGDIEMHPWAP